MGQYRKLMKSEENQWRNDDILPASKMLAASGGNMALLLPRKSFDGAKTLAENQRKVMAKEMKMSISWRIEEA